MAYKIKNKSGKTIYFSKNSWKYLLENARQNDWKPDGAIKGKYPERF
jgi:hypothetical protein